MKLLFFVLTLFISSTVFSSDQWFIRDTVNGKPRSVSSVFVLDGEGYIIGGLDENGFRRKMYSYDIGQDDWDQETALGGANGAGLNRGSAVAFTLQGKAYVGLGQGQTNGFFQDFWEYDPVTETWSQKANFAGGPRRQAVAFVLDTTAYVGTGIAPDGLKRDMYSYDASTNQWTQLNDFGGSARKEATAFVMGDQAYIGTGDDGVMKKDFWQYEPSTDSWIQKPDFPGTPRKGAVGWGVFPNGYICTGEDINFEYKKDLWEYNYFNETWTQRADLIGPGRSNAVAFTIGQFAFVGTGYDGTFMEDLYMYAPVLNTSELDISDNISIFPNPIDDKFFLSSPSPVKDLQLFDSSGKNLSHKISSKNMGDNIEIHGHDIPSGTYWLSILHENMDERISKRIIFN